MMAQSSDKKGASRGDSGKGLFVLENARGQVVRSFSWSAARIYVVLRADTQRIETLASLEPLKAQNISYLLLAESASKSEIKKNPVAIGQGSDYRGRIRWVEDIDNVSASFAQSHSMAQESDENTKKIIGWTAGGQLVAMLLVILIGSFLAKKSASPETTVTLLPEATVEKMIAAEKNAPKAAVAAAVPARKTTVAAPVRQPIVVAPSETKITKLTPVPTRSTSFKKNARRSPVKNIAKGPRAGGYKGEGKRGYGTDEAHMNSIGALGALDNASRKGGNGGHGGLNLQAVGTEAGSGAGGHGYGGFGQNGGGGKGLGGIGQGKGSGLANAMYGKGLIAAPFGDGSPAPGAGGYGTRGKAGGGAQGAGYGAMTIVGSWKGTGPKGSGPAGSGAGNGGTGSPWGSAQGDDGDLLVTGGLDRDQIAEVIARNIGQITYCYEQGLQAKPDLSGRVAVRFQIGGGGRVGLSTVAHSSVHSAQVESCISGKVKNWIFPKPQGGVTVAVTYPFVLRRVSQR